MKLPLLMILFALGNIIDPFSAHRQLFIFGQEDNQSLVVKQLCLMDSATAGLKERAVKITVVPKESSLFVQYKVKSGSFTVILVGKDGTEKYRSNQLLKPGDLYMLIDAMPMRRAEMGNQ